MVMRDEYPRISKNGCHMVVICDHSLLPIFHEIFLIVLKVHVSICWFLMIKLMNVDDLCILRSRSKQLNQGAKLNRPQIVDIFSQRCITLEADRGRVSRTTTHFIGQELSESLDYGPSNPFFSDVCWPKPRADLGAKGWSSKRKPGNSVSNALGFCSNGPGNPGIGTKKCGWGTTMMGRS